MCRYPHRDRNMFGCTVFILLVTMTLANDGSFEVFDENDDGKITLDEAVSYFQDFDENNDGANNMDEFVDAINRIDPAFEGDEDFIFKILDFDSDGQFSKTDIEFAFQLADLNKDTVVSKPELDLFMAALHLLILTKPIPLSSDILSAATGTIYSLVKH